MFDTSLQNWHDELSRAEDFWKDYLGEGYAGAIERYHGSGYKGTHDIAENEPEPHSLEWMTLYLPQICYGQPRVRIESSRGGPFKERAKALQFGLNRWIKQTNFKRVLEKAAVNYGLRWCVTLTTRDKMPGHSESETEDAPGWPSVTNLDLRWFRADPASLEPEKWRWQSHAVIWDKGALIQHAEERNKLKDPAEHWNIDAIEALGEDTGTGVLRSDAQNEGPERGEVVLWYCWLPEEQTTPKGQKDEDYGPENGYNGTWYVVGYDQDDLQKKQGAFIRDPYPHWGPREGPYTFAGYLTVPGEAVPLGPIAATQAQVDSLNELARAQATADATYKKLILVGEEDPNFQKIVVEGGDLEVYACDLGEDMRARYAVLETGGSSPTLDMAVERHRNRVDRTTGIHEAMRGNVEGSGTATEVMAAQQASSARGGFLVQKFREEQAEKALRKVAWYLHHDDSVSFGLGQDAVGQFHGQMGQPIENPDFQGGLQEGDSYTDFDSLDLTIEAYSMEKTSEALQQARLQGLMEMLGVAVPMVVQFPFINGTELFKTIGEWMNVPDLDGIIDGQMAQQFGAAMLQMQMQGAQEGGGGAQSAGGLSGGSQPRLQRDQPRPSGNGQTAQGALGGYLSGSQAAHAMRTDQ